MPHLLYRHGRPDGHFAFEDDVEHVAQLAVLDHHRIFWVLRVLQTVANFCHFLRFKLALPEKSDVSEQWSHRSQFKSAALLGWLGQDGPDQGELGLLLDHGLPFEQLAWHVILIGGQ